MFLVPSLDLPTERLIPVWVPDVTATRFIPLILHPSILMVQFEAVNTTKILLAAFPFEAVWLHLSSVADTPVAFVLTP